jgi:hypothetical protein
MLEYLQDLLKELKKLVENDITLIYIKDTKQKVIALETAIEILEKLKNNERNVLNGKIK